MFRFWSFLFPFSDCIIRNVVPLTKNVFVTMNSSSLNIFSTRHVIYSVSEKVCLEKKTTQL